MEQLINITDAIFLGHVGEVELGASALASVYYLAIYMLGFGFSLGLQVMIARRNGEQRYKETGKTFFQGLFFLSGLAVFLSFTSYVLSPVILKFFIHSPEIYKTVVDYLSGDVSACYSLFRFLHFALSLLGLRKREYCRGQLLSQFLSTSHVITCLFSVLIGGFQGRQ